MPRSTIEGCAVRSSKSKADKTVGIASKAALFKVSNITGAIVHTPKYGTNPHRMKVTLPKLKFMEYKLSADS